MNAIEIIREQLAACEARKDHAVVTIVTSDGSAPRSNGKMIVYPDGTAHGTIGGGAVELLAIRDAVNCIRNGTNLYKSYDLASSASESGMACSGKVSLFIEAYRTRPLLVMIGAGHVGGAILRLASFLNYETLLIDDRTDEQIGDKIALADRFVRVKNFEEEIRSLDFAPGASIVIATHGHLSDSDALTGAIGKDAVYLGMIGSSRKIAAIFANMREKGIPDAQLNKVFTPIGLDIGGETPEEIALAVMAEIQMLRYGRTGTHLMNRER